MTPFDPITSTLRMCPNNPRYFSGADGRAIFLTGSHTWNNLVDMGKKGAVTPFDWNGYLDFLERHGHNFVRLWAWDMLATWDPKDDVLQFPWKRTGPGLAADGRPKFDLTQFEESYFQRLIERVRLAQQRGIYVNVMLFDSWSQFEGNKTPLAHHVFAWQNNINGIDVLQTLQRGLLTGWCTLANPAILALQKTYIQRVVRELNPFFNVLYEISNEAGFESHAWQEHLTGYIRRLEADLPNRHPVAQTGGMGTANRMLHQSTADCVAPGRWDHERHADGYATGQDTGGTGPYEKSDRPIFLDTDHLWGIGGDEGWAWKSFCRGYNVLYMDRWDDQPAAFFQHPSWPDPVNTTLRREMGVTREFSRRIDLTASAPANHLASTGYCLAVPERQLIVFNPCGGEMSVELASLNWNVTWHDPSSGETHPAEIRHVGQPGSRTFVPPFQGPSVLLLKAS